MTYASYVGSGIGNAASTGGTSDDINKGFTSTNTGSLYIAFMYNPKTASTTSDYSVMLGTAAGTSVTSFYGKFYVQKDASNNLRFGITKSNAASISYTGYTYSLNTTYMIVIRYDFVSGTANDQAYLFINPVLGGTEPAASLTGATDAAADPAQLTSICLRQSTTTAGASYDGIRIGTTWASVTPSSAPIVTAASPTGTVGTAFSYTISATNSPTSYAIANGTLPAGLSLNTTNGLISGTPTTAETPIVGVTATNGSGASAAANLSFNISAAGLSSQTITFGALTPAIYGDAAFGLTATASSNLAVSYASSNTAVATVSGSTVTIVGAGSTDITASQAGDVNYNAAPDVIQSLVVGAKALTVTSPIASDKVYTGTNPTTTTIAGTLAGIVGADDVILVGTGTFATVNVANGISVASTSTLGGTKAGNYSLAQPTGLTANITQAPQTISFAATAHKTTASSDYNGGATSATSGTNSITYVSSNLSVATIVSGLIHIVGVGTTTITASQAASSNYLAATDKTQTLTVALPPLAGWDFNAVTSAGVATFTANTFNSNLISTAGASDIVRGATAALSSGASSFRTVGFKNEGISTANTDYFQISLAPTTGKLLSLSTIDADFVGTATFAASPGVSSQFSYSLDGTNFTLIGSPQIIIGTPQTLAQIDLSGIAALQNVPNGTTITIRYYASGQTTSGGWGFSSATVGTDGLAIRGSVIAMAPTTSIPDPNFEAKLIALGIDSGVADGKVLTSSINTLTTLDVSSSSITNLTGIQDFVALQDLRCSNNSLTSLNVSALTNLRTLYCDNNSLPSLDLHLLSNLNYLECENNLITDLNISGLTNLYYIGCKSNKLTTLNVSAYPGLTYLDVDDNNLTSLIVPTGTILNDLYCSNNNLTSLDLSGLTKLDFFEATGNPLTCVIVDYASLVRPTLTSNLTIPEWTVDDRTVFGYNTVLFADITEQYSSTPTALTTNIKCSKNITGTPNKTFPITTSTVVTWTFDGGSGNIITANQNVIIQAARWDGSAWSNTTGPTASIEAVIEGVYSTTTNGVFTAKKVTVNSGSLTVNSGTNLTVQNELVNNLTADKVVIENNANLVQVNAVSNTGAITVNRNSASLKLLDYTLWSSPVIGQKLKAFSPATLDTRFYTYNPSSNIYAAVSSPLTTDFAIGTGYLIRMPNDHPTTATVWNGTFTGTPNNGNVNVTVANAAFNAVGNPYPSTLSADAFISANAITEALYFWRKTNGVIGTAYATYTMAGGVGTGAGTGGITPNGTIQLGQGFIAKATSGTITFTNAMRTTNNANQFLKTKLTEKNRIWLNLSAGSEPVNQMMVAYMDGATTGIDAAIDGRYINDNPTALNSDINGEEFVIQGKGLPFDATDTVPLTFKTASAGSFTIAIDHVDGLFSNNQEIFLKDTATGIEQDLKVGSYTFTSNVGAFNSRFLLTYKASKSLGINNLVFDANSILVFKQNGALNINAGKTVIKNLRVFDIKGMLIFEQKDVNASTTTLKNFMEGKQTILIQITSDENKTVTKKAIY